MMIRSVLSREETNHNCLLVRSLYHKVMGLRFEDAKRSSKLTINNNGNLMDFVTCHKYINRRTIWKKGCQKTYLYPHAPYSYPNDINYLRSFPYSSMVFLLLILLNSIVSTTTQQQTTESEAFIKVTKFTVPPIVRAGDQAKLVCNYELSSGETLHAMKLFKDDKEFYRYMPVIRLEDRKLAFPLEGVHVDMVKSNHHDIFLRNINKQSAGQYKCQVSVENTFKSISAVKKMEVRDRLPSQELNAHNGNLGAPNSMTGLGIVSNGNYNSNNNLFNNRQQQQRHAILKQQQQQFNNKHHPSLLMNQMTSMPVQQQQHKQQASSSSSSRSGETIISTLLQLYSVLQMISLLMF